MDLHDRVCYLEERLIALEKKLSEENEYHKYLIASQSKHVVEAIEQYKKEAVPLRNRSIVMWPKYRKL